MEQLNDIIPAVELKLDTASIEMLNEASA